MGSTQLTPRETSSSQTYTGSTGEPECEDDDDCQYSETECEDDEDCQHGESECEEDENCQYGDTECEEDENCHHGKICKHNRCVGGTIYGLVSATVPLFIVVGYCIQMQVLS